MRALLLSDIHGDLTTLRWLLEMVWKQTGPIDAYICLGDGVRDFAHVERFIQERDEHARFYAVRGNCDWGVDAPDRLVVDLGGAKCFLTHGHLQRVKSTLYHLQDAARDAGCTIALYGHTHVPDVATGVPMCVNPGSAADDRCALLEVTDGHPRVKLLSF